MCAAFNSIQTQKSTVVSSTPSKATKPIPKWMKMKQQNRSSAGQTAKPIAKHSSSAQKPNQPSRNEKRARWAKKSKPVAKPVVKRGPVYEYLCECHSEPAKKPAAGTKVVKQDPESKKMKDTFLGLGKWRCATTGKRCKVTPRKPAPKAVGNTSSLSCPDIIYPAKLHTPVLVEAPVATATV